jgi:NADPH:quinone reductase-like Zn-dependent oxidoreductase
MFAFNIHDSVFGMCENSRWGTFGEYAIFKAKDLALKPRELSWAKAASIPVAAVTAYDAFGMITKRLDQIQKIVILDDGRSGGIAQMLILLAKNYFMIRQVIVSCPSIHFDYYRSLGADLLIEMSTQRFDDYLMSLPPETISVQPAPTTGVPGGAMNVM